MGCLVAIGIILLIALYATYPIPAIFITVIILVISVIRGHYNKIEKEKKQREEVEALGIARKAYYESRASVSIPVDALEVQFKRDDKSTHDSTNSIWVDNGDLCLFPAYPPNNSTNRTFKEFRIPIQKIEYFATRGEIVHETKISGGGGGGSSIGGAVVGGVIAGGAGAVIGSRQKTSPIKSELLTHDSRETFLNYFSGNNMRDTIVFCFEDYNKFNDLLPEKTYEIVNAVKSNILISKALSENDSTSITNQIRELAKLRDEGILTEVEFSTKKQKLLEKIG